MACLAISTNQRTHCQCTCSVAREVLFQLLKVAASACLEILAEARAASLRRPGQANERLVGGCAAQHPGTCARNFIANSSGSENRAADACRRSARNSAPARFSEPHEFAMKMHAHVPGWCAAHPPMRRSFQCVAHLSAPAAAATLHERQLDSPDMQLLQLAAAG